MSPRASRIAKFIGYPLFYLVCLALFGYLSFPFDQLKGRIEAEFDRLQQRSARRSRSQDEPMRLQIGELDSYWLTGVEIRQARLIIPPKKAAPTRGRSKAASALAGAGDEAPVKPSVLTIERLTARLQILPLLGGDVRFAFSAEALGGEIEGVVPYGQDSGDVEMTMEGLQLAQIEPLKALLADVPISGVVSGALRLAPHEGKFAKASGKLELHIDDVVVFDGKSKLQGVALPAAHIGAIAIDAPVEDGVVKLEELVANGKHFVLNGSGKIKLHESWDRAQADLALRFKFANEYRDKDDATRSLLGKPGENFPPLLEIAPGSKFKRAKCDEDFYCFSVRGPLSKLDFQPGQRGGARTSSKSGSSKAPLRRPSTEAGRPPKEDGEDDRPEPPAPPPAHEEKDEPPEPPPPVTPPTPPPAPPPAAPEPEPEPEEHPQEDPPADGPPEEE